MGCASSRHGSANPGSDARSSSEPQKTADIAGIIRVAIKYAKDLPSNDIGGKCDPFCTLSYGDSTYRTEVLRNNRSPTFNTTAMLPVPKIQLQGPHVLRLAVYDKDRLTVNDFVGMILIDASGVIASGDEIEHREEALLPQAETVNQLADAVQNEESAQTRSETEHNRGRIAYGLRFMPAEEVLRDFWSRLFQVVDEDGNGTLSVAEFRELLRLTAADADAVTDARLKAVFAMADQNKDGRVTMEELHKWLATPECRSILDEGLIYSMFIEACWDDSQQDSDTALLKDAFRTEKEAARGWLFRVTEWMGGSRYDMGLNVGARAKAVLIKDRSTGLVQEEKISAGLNFAMRVMYQSKVGSGLLGLGSSQALLTKMTEEAGRHFDRPQTKSKIPDFIEQYGLNTAEIKKPLDDFANFNEFFYRQLVDGCRPIDDPHDDAVAVSAADCRALFFDSVAESQQLWIKGQNFTLKALLQGGDEGLKPELVDKFKDAAVAIFRLAPQDYHRFHYGVAGVVSEKPYFLGKQYFTVNPVAINAYDVFTENKRAVTVVESREFGTVVVVAVGATLVGSINFTGVPKMGAEDSDLEMRSVKRGDEHGYFAYGGSTVIYLFEKGRIAFSNDLLENSQKQMETYVRVGNHIGRSAGS